MLVEDASISYKSCRYQIWNMAISVMEGGNVGCGTWNMEVLAREEGSIY